MRGSDAPPLALKPGSLVSLRVDERSARPSGSGGGRTADGHTPAMLWRCDPMSFDYVFPGDESFLVLAGSVRIVLEDGGETIELRTGDVASFPKGTRSVWTILEPLKKFTVVSG